MLCFIADGVKAEANGAQLGEVSVFGHYNG